MTSTTRPPDAPPASTALPGAADLLLRADRTIAAALAEGALQPIRTEQDWLEQAGLRFSVRWVSSLALKDRARVDTVTARRPDFNPFLPPEPALTVAPLGASHCVVLNKFPVIERHLLIVTRHFEDQCAPLTAADFAALASVVGAHGGLGFYNGGRIAGASQAHKHLQWIPSGADGVARFLPPLEEGAALDNPALPWAHAVVAVGEADWAGPGQRWRSRARGLPPGLRAPGNALRRHADAALQSAADARGAGAGATHAGEMERRVDQFAGVGGVAIRA